MNKIILSTLLSSLTFLTFGQNYVDLVKLTHTQVPNSVFENNPNISTPITQTKLSTSIPITLNDSLVFLTGVDYELHRLKLNPLAADFSNLNIATLKLGFNIKHNSKLTGTYLALPKLASDFGHLNKSFQIGAIALWKFKLNTQTKLVFGNYINTERFGILNVPIFGVYHKSKNEKTEIDIKFPITGFGDYKVHKNIRLGADFLLIVRTFDLAKSDVNEFYVHTASNELAAYLQFDLLKERLIIKAKAVYAMYDYGMYADGDGTPFGMLGWYPGDQRMRLNSETSSALGFKVSAFYRFQL
ncbi:MAG: hypothetical protein CMD35_07055 [Flavobacteriales bacterium]|nr:hypothetical protein [Flavobacteriales bacterium]